MMHLNDRHAIQERDLDRGDPVARFKSHNDNPLLLLEVLGGLFRVGQTERNPHPDRQGGTLLQDFSYGTRDRGSRRTCRRGDLEVHGPNCAEIIDWSLYVSDKPSRDDLAGQAHCR